MHDNFLFFLSFHFATQLLDDADLRIISGGALHTNGVALECGGGGGGRAVSFFSYTFVYESKYLRT